MPPPKCPDDSKCFADAYNCDPVDDIDPPSPTDLPVPCPPAELDPTLTPTLSPTLSPVLTAKPTKRPSTPYPTKYPTSPVSATNIHQFYNL